MKKKLIVPIIVLALLVAGTAGFFLVQQHKKTTISEPAKKVIEAILTCPNPDLYDPAAIVKLGLGVPPLSDERKAELKAVNERLTKNWDNLIGKYFAENCFNGFLTSAGVSYYQTISVEEDVKVTLKDMTLVEKDFYEKIHVTVGLDDKEHVLEFVFQYNEKGQITRAFLSKVTQ